MSHCSMFKKSSNEEGYIMIICHRERYKDELESLGFVDHPDKLKVSKPVEAVEVIEPVKTNKSGKGRK